MKKTDEIRRIERAVGISDETDCPPGFEWFQNPSNVAKLGCIANVVIYIEAEFGIETAEEREKIVGFLTDLHTAFGRRIQAGEKIEAIRLPEATVKEYTDEIGSRIPGEVFVEGMRRQFKNA